METKLYSLYQPHHFSPNLGFPSINLNSTLKLPSKLTSPKLGFRKSLRVFASILTSQGESQESSTFEREREKQSSASVNPVYVPTPPNRELRTPHSGYHFDGSTRRFFEGWYFKVSIPELRQSFCYMYTVENPAFPKKLSALEVAQYGPRFTGVGAQILGADEKYICQYSEESQNFWGNLPLLVLEPSRLYDCLRDGLGSHPLVPLGLYLKPRPQVLTNTIEGSHHVAANRKRKGGGGQGRHELILGNTFIAEKELKPPNKEVPPQEFNKSVLEGFQVSPYWHQGFIRDDGRSNYVETVKTARWEYSTRPTYGWGNVQSKQKSTAGWLAAFPVFEPHWQICMAGGLSTGWIEWDGERIEFQNAPSYSEKNWGGAFPRKWFWVQCNVFEGASGDVALTVGGGLRQLPGLTENFENAALIGVHYGGIFYEFVPWNGVVGWEIAPWGKWYFVGENQTHKVELEATTKDLGTTLRAPTTEAGLSPACKDTCFGVLRLQMWERRSDGSKGKIILDVTSDMAALEVGGGPWFSTWKGETSAPELLRQALRVPVDMEGIFGLVPIFKPPGL
ncbi:tocopherol cyclase, chloroplastic [Fagus crenata]